METLYNKGLCRNKGISNIWNIYPISITTLDILIIGILPWNMTFSNVVALNPSHDLSSLNLAALTIITMHPSMNISIPPSASSPKHGSPSDSSLWAPRKHQQSHCFRCGGQDHFPADCKAELTVSGRTTAKLVPTAKSKHAMLAPNGKQFCFSWAQHTSCSYSSACANFHRCSICGDLNHGAGSCKAQSWSSACSHPTWCWSGGENTL